MHAPLFIVDAFTDRAFSGNPAAVCLLDVPAPDAWMRGVAAEMNLSETAFLFPEGETWRLRWFTPTVEVDLCGHATLASAHVLLTTAVEGRHSSRGETLSFETRSGSLTAVRSGTGIAMDFPSTPARPADPPEELLTAVHAGSRPVTPVSAGRNETDWLLEVEDEEIVRQVAPDFRALAGIDARGVIVTAAAGDRTRREHPEADFVSRFFGPAVGVDEDPVTGSAHCTLGPWWSSRLGRSDLTGRQVSARGGTVGVRMQGDRVTLRGEAVTVLEGRLRTTELHRGAHS
ncbi:MAG: PhzF family phenazine biosynthesis protein [Gemmatimonadota bacterium]